MATLQKLKYVCDRLKKTLVSSVIISLSTLGASTLAMAQIDDGSDASINEATIFQDQFVLFTNRLRARYPERISRIWFDPAPMKRGYIRFVGDIPVRLGRRIADGSIWDGVQQRWSMLNSGTVVIEGGGLFNSNERKELNKAVVNTMKSQGYRNFIAYFDSETKKFTIETRVDSAGDNPQVMSAQTSSLKSEMSKAVYSGIEIYLNGSADVSMRNNRIATTTGQSLLDQIDIEIISVPGVGPILTDDHSRGGNLIRNSGTGGACTSGWSVFGPRGDGIITAGHCTGMNEFSSIQTGETSYGMAWRSQSFADGAEGDVEYHVTEHWELHEFFATDTTIRPVEGIQPTASMEGRSICIYGRGSNIRDCAGPSGDTLVVDANPGELTGTNSDGITSTGLARTRQAVDNLGGDSGGGVSWVRTAFGVHKGRDSRNIGYFTPIETAERLLGVTVKTTSNSNCPPSC